VTLLQSSAADSVIHLIDWYGRDWPMTAVPMTLMYSRRCSIRGIFFALGAAENFYFVTKTKDCDQEEASHLQKKKILSWSGTSGPTYWR
jgi:hypothetical protein